MPTSQKILNGITVSLFFGSLTLLSEIGISGDGPPMPGILYLLLLVGGIAAIAKKQSAFGSGILLGIVLSMVHTGWVLGLTDPTLAVLVSLLGFGYAFGAYVAFPSLPQEELEVEH